MSKRVARVLTLTVVLAAATGWLAVVGSYRLEMIGTVPMYGASENRPLDEQVAVRYLQPKESVDVVRCVDIKTEIYFVVETSDGDSGVIYSLDAVIRKQPFWAHPSRWGDAFVHPLESLTCGAVLSHRLD